MLTIKVKGISKLTDTLTEEDGQFHCEGVLYKPSVIEELRGMDKLVIKDFYYYSDKYAIGIEKANGVTTYISPKWVEEITDGTTTLKTLKTTAKKMSGYVEFKTGYLYKEADMTIVKKDTLPLCDCGTFIHDDKELLALGICSKCYVAKHFNVRNYSYKPKPKFTGTQIASNNGNEVWYGVELEYGLNDKLAISKLVAKHNIYLKSDASINGGSEGGAEMVTHPYSFSGLMSGNSWVDELDTIDCNDSNNNGCHIHVGRTAWVDDKHFALTYFLMYELATLGLLEQIGDRPFNNYCELNTPIERIHQVKKEKVAGMSKARGLWCNENNDATVEFRFFNGTNDPKQLKRYVQLLEGVIKYTKFHTKTVTTQGLFAYIRKHATKYAELNEFTSSWDITNKTVTYTEPRRKDVDFSKLTILEIPFIAVLETHDGEVHDSVTGAYVDGTTLYYRNNNSSKSVRLNAVKKVTLEV